MKVEITLTAEQMDALKDVYDPHGELDVEMDADDYAEAIIDILRADFIERGVDF